MSATVDIAALQGWVGRANEAREVLTGGLIDRFAATFGLDGAAVAGGLGFVHWCLCPDLCPTQDLGPDGHPARGGFLPPVPLPRRMWAGGEITFHAPLLPGETVLRRSVIENVTHKSGRSGELVFVTVRQEYSVDGDRRIGERQDIVYRAMPDGPAPQRAPVCRDDIPAPIAAEDIRPDAALLLRYSALTFNAHRIHYDRPYAREVEFYPDLVVHGPLQATQLGLLAARCLGRPLRRFAFRSRAPIFADAEYRLEARQGARGLELCSLQAGHPAMEAEAE